MIAGSRKWLVVDCWKPLPIASTRLACGIALRFSKNTGCFGDAPAAPPGTITVSGILIRAPGIETNAASIHQFANSTLPATDQHEPSQACCLQGFAHSIDQADAE
jgi:hypothetical protein